MRTLILHGGAPKTGTSFLQVLFAQNAEKMKENGVLYPEGHMFDEAKKGKITSGNGVEIANYIRPHLPHRIDDLDSFPERFEAILESAGNLDVLLSSEFLNCPYNDRMKNLLSIVDQKGFDIKYVYFVRNIGLSAFSSYSQQVKRHGESRSFQDFISGWDPLYRNTLDMAINSVGEENVRVFNFDEHRENLAAFFFEAVLGLNFSPEVSKKVVNRSLSTNEAEMLRLINESTGGRAKVSTYISDALMGSPRPSEAFSLSKAEVDELEKRFRVAVDYVNKYITGRPIIIFDDAGSEMAPIVSSDFEKAMVVIIGQLVKDIAK